MIIVTNVTTRMIALTLFMTGCGRETVSDREVLEALHRSTPTGPASTVIEHDFGPILARGQILTHEFLLRNSSDRPMVLGKPEVSTPCCSAVESAPGSIPANGSATLTIAFRPGFQSGPKRVGFVIPTDSSAMPRFDLRASATLFGEVEVRLIEGLKTPVVGQGGTMTLRVISRSAGMVGRPAPDRIETSESIAARFVGPAGERKVDDGILEASRDVEVTLSPIDRAGTRQGELRVLWPDGRDWVHTVAWQVRPLVYATPRGLILGADAASQEYVVSVRSEDRPIRVIGVEGPALASPAGPFDPTPRMSQSVRLALDPAKAMAGASDILIKTDHPGQPQVALSVLSVLSTPGAGKERP